MVTTCDVIQIPCEVFYFNKPSLLDTNIQDKLIDILAGYDCFKENYTPRFVTKTKYIPNLDKRTVGIRPLKVISNESQSTKDILSLLNKLNDSNFNTISRKFIRNITDSNINQIIDRIAMLCHRQHSYIHVYTSLLQKILMHHNSSCVYKSIDDVYITEKSNIKSLILHVEQIRSDYDSLCSDLKLRETIAGTNLFIIHLINKDLIKTPIHGYFMYLLSLIEEFGHNHPSTEVLVQLLFDYFRLNPNMEHLHMLRRLHKKIEPSLNTKTRFKLMDIYEKIDYCR